MGPGGGVLCLCHVHAGVLLLAAHGEASVVQEEPGGFLAIA